ncbi:MAG: kynureninase [Ardenticatenaceae bacterium]|nr:kynureninase [Ardenticatenaceae bacterium]
MRTDADYASALDRQDELAHFRDEFLRDDPDLIYLDGNSLGRLPKRSVERLRDVVEREWGRRLIRGWSEGWFTLPQRIGAKIARLIGADADEVLVSDSTSVNLFKLILAALQARPGRTKVVTDDLNFPSDIYILQGVLRLAGPQYHLAIVRSVDGLTVTDEALASAIDESTALVALTHTAFKSGFVYDLDVVTALAHRVGAMMLWDLCHSVGAMPLALDVAGVDLAVGCTYKYLNAGPGAPAFLFVRRDLQAHLLNPVSGWFGQQNQFDFELAYRPAAGIRRFLAGTPPVLSLAAVEPGVDLLLEAGMDRLRAKSRQQTEYLIGLWEALLEPLGFELNSPRDPRRRGSHVSLGHPEALRIDRALIEEMNVIPDFRSPDNLRLGIAPIYTSFAEIHEAVMRLRRVVVEQLYEKYPKERPEVT